MPYGGDSDKGLIKLLNEVAMPQTNNAAYDLSTPAANLFYLPKFKRQYGRFQSDIFSLFRLRKKLGEK